MRHFRTAPVHKVDLDNIIEFSVQFRYAELVHFPRFSRFETQTTGVIEIIDCFHCPRIPFARGLQ